MSDLCPAGCGVPADAPVADHDSAQHVAKTYHYATDGRCASCSEEWPCATRKQYGGPPHAPLVPA